MDWVCTECERTYDETAPHECPVCGNDRIVPANEADASSLDAALSRVRERLLDPLGTDRSLVDDSPTVALVFRALVAALILLALVAAASVLLGV